MEDEEIRMGKEMMLTLFIVCLLSKSGDSEDHHEICLSANRYLDVS
jgi:hypothetical protein